MAKLMRTERVRDAVGGKVVHDNCARRRRPVFGAGALDPRDVAARNGNVCVVDVSRRDDSRPSEGDTRCAVRGRRVRNRAAVDVRIERDALPGHDRDAAERPLWPSRPKLAPNRLRAHRDAETGRHLLPASGHAIELDRADERGRRRGRSQGRDVLADAVRETRVVGEATRNRDASGTPQPAERRRLENVRRVRRPDDVRPGENGTPADPGVRRNEGQRRQQRNPHTR